MVMFVTLFNAGEFTVTSMITAVAVSFGGAAVFWFIGIIIGDVLFKGVITDIETDATALTDGGLLQRIHSFRQKDAPGAAAAPPAPVKTAEPANGSE